MIYDLIIIGGSASATAAGIYAVRRNLNLKILTKDFGGEVATSGEINNYPGIINTNGIELTEKFRKHLKEYGVEPEIGVEVESVEKQLDNLFCIRTKKVGFSAMAKDRIELDKNGLLKEKCDYLAKSVIIATGVRPRELNVPGDREYRNKGVSYCTTCDGPLFKDRITVTIGGGNSALESSLMMASIAKKHYVINKNPDFKGDAILVKKLEQQKNVEIIYNAKTTEIFGDGKFVKGLKYINTINNELKELILDGIFIHIGMIPNSQVAPKEVERNEFGEIKVGKKCETNVPGLFAAGDVTDVPFKQISIAIGQGTIASLAVQEYLNKLSQ